MLTTAQTSKEFPKKEIKVACIAHQLLTMLGHPSNADLANMVSFNVIKHCPITVCDINNTTHIFGHDITTARGKTMRKSSDPMVVDYVAVPLGLKQLNTNVIISADMMFAGGLGFFITGLWGI